MEEDEDEEVDGNGVERIGEERQKTERIISGRIIGSDGEG